MKFEVKGQYLLVLFLGLLKTTSAAHIDCGANYTIAHGHVDFKGRQTTVKSRIPVTCDKGYKIQGDKEITCQQNGKWSTGTACQIIDCGKTHTIKNGQITWTGKKTTFNQTVPVICNAGFQVFNKPYLTCLDDGTWSTNTLCHPMSCSKEFTVDNGQVDYQGRDSMVHDSVPVSCDEGYALHGDQKITCQPDGSWSKNTRCLIKDCGNRYYPANGYADYNGKTTTYGHQVPVSCEDGYRIKGDPHITCLSDGTWSTDTTCVLKDCGTVYSMPHGHVSFTGQKTTFGSVIPVTCDKGYQIHGEIHITCLPDGTWSKSSKCLPTVDCGTKFTVANGKVNFTGKDTTYNHKVPVICNTGYKVVGSSPYITCQANGSWSNTTACQLVDCGTTYSISHGYANFVGRETTFKQIVSITCNTGYELHGDQHITCLENGHWSRKTSCEVKNCSTSIIIANGHVDLTGRSTSYGQAAPVICAEGFEIHGDAFITCTADGTWSKETSCQKKDCGTDYQLENGFIDYNGKATTVGEKVPLFCNSGFVREGDSDTTCQSDGTWSKFTKCRSIECGTEYLIDNGYADFIDRKTSYTSTIPIVCDAGYELHGDEKTTCQADGTWSKNTTCKIKDCGSQYTIAFGYVNFLGMDTTYGSKVAVSCDTGYYIEGNSSITCLANGKWTRDAVCRVRDCGTNYPLANGHADFAGRKTVYNEKIPIKCDDGYEVQGEYRISCLEDGTWSKNTFCRIRDCGTDYVLENGYVEFSGKTTTYNERIPVTCSNGYKNQGEDHILCQANGTWTKGTACQLRDCGARYKISNGQVDFSGKATTYNKIVPVVCSPGYEVHGDEFITCLANGDWSRTECHPKDCGKKYYLENGHVDFNGKDTTFDHQAPVVCDSGYEIQGNGYVTCLSDGKWSTSSRCHIKDCGTEYTLAHGFANFNGKKTTFNHSIPIVCNKGYEILGDPEITCLATGKWSTNTQCHIEDCGDKYELKNGKANFTDRSTKYKHKIPVTCDVGYDLVGDTYITCLADGSWSKETSCKIKDCGKDFKLDGGQANFGNRPTTYKNKVPVSCLDGYNLHGDNYTICLASGKWSKTAECVPKDCGKHYPVKNGAVDFTGQDTTYKNKVMVSCNVGYEIDGPPEITCLATGSWSMDTKCRIKDCGTDFILQNGQINFAGRKTVFNQTIPVSCDPGYDLQGDHFTTCLADGSWSKRTTCVIKDCGNTYLLSHGYVNFTGIKTTFGQRIPVECNEGYEVIGDNHIKCQANGSWSKNTQCQIRDCGKETAFEHGSVDFANLPTTYNKSFTVTCAENYEIEGDSKITCLANGTWSQNTVCRAKPAKATGSKGAVVGGVLGGLVAAVIVVVIIVMMRKNQKLCFAKKSILDKEFGDLENENRVTM